MSSVNKVILIGNIGQDPEVRYLDKGVAIANFNLATTERGYQMQNGTQVPDRTDWHYLMFSKRLAKIVEQYVHKGDKIYVEGRLRNRSYDDKRGIRHQYTEIEVENMELLTPRSLSLTQSQAQQQPKTSQQAQQRQQQQEAENNDKLPF